jgi:hypothetical protein
VRLPALLTRLAESAAGTVELREQLGQAAESNLLLAESVAGLERQLMEAGWTRFVALAEQEFTPEGLKQLRAICRLYSIKNPLLKRGLALRSAYVWGQGAEISARANGSKGNGEQDVQGVITAFLDDDLNAAAVTGPAARTRLERTLGTDGEVFLACFTRPLTGDVQVRTLPADDIVDVIRNPEDAAETWFFRRRWTRVTYGPTGEPTNEVLERFYPALGYRPAARPRSIAGFPVAWDAPVLHLKVNEPDGWKRGIPDAYAAVDWARAYREFLEDWARLMRSLARYAWKATASGSKAAQARSKLGQLDANGEPGGAGATALLGPDVTLEAVSKSGATIDADSGRPLAAMVATALGIPVTMLLGDPGVSGARATAETLDRPTELEMSERRELWAAAYQRLLRYVIVESVRAPQGALKGVIKRDPASGKETLTLTGDTDTTIDLVWPALDDIDPETLVKAIVEAASTGVLPPEEVARLLLTALGVRDVDAILDGLVDEDGNFQYPAPPDIGAAGRNALNAHRAGADPADALPGGAMAPDDEDPSADDGEGDGGGEPEVSAAPAAATGDRGRRSRRGDS